MTPSNIEVTYDDPYNSSCVKTVAGTLDLTERTDIVGPLDVKLEYNPIVEIKDVGVFKYGPDYGTGPKYGDDSAVVVSNCNDSNNNGKPDYGEAPQDKASDPDLLSVKWGYTGQQAQLQLKLRAVKEGQAHLIRKTEDAEGKITWSQMDIGNGETLLDISLQKKPGAENVYQGSGEFWLEGGDSQSAPGTTIEIKLWKDNKPVEPQKPMTVIVLGLTKVRLGETVPQIFADTEHRIFAAYVPSKWGGKMEILPYSKPILFFYSDGSWATNEQVKDMFKADLSNAQAPGQKTFDEGKYGWVFFRVEGKEAAIQMKFIEEHCLPRMEDSNPSNDVWNSWWWPKDDGQDPNLYDLTIGTEPGPLVKFDDYVDKENPDDGSAQKWERDPQYGEYYEAGTGGAAGHCAGMAQAGFEEQKPLAAWAAQDGTGKWVTFLKQDIIGLCAERWEIALEGPGSKDEPGDNHQLFRYYQADIDAKWFHDKLRTRLSKNQGGLLFYIDSFNCGVYKYRAELVAKGTEGNEIYGVTVTNKLFYVDWVMSGFPGTLFSTATDAQRVAEYKVIYATDGTIDSEVAWMSGKPDRVHWNKATAPMRNDKLEANRAAVENIIRH